MNVSTLDRIMEQVIAPTEDAIRQQKQQQLDALQYLRKCLAQGLVHSGGQAPPQVWAESIG